jgi:uncharacterized protein
MKLDLNEILSRVGMRYPYKVDEPPLVDEDLECSSSITGEIVFTNTGDILLMNGGISTRVTLLCSRCLEYYDQEVRVGIEEFYPLQSRPVGTRGRQYEVVVETDENPDAINLFDGYFFDLTEFLRQNIMLELPTQPLHDAECKGLCPVCGCNRNLTVCHCEDNQINPMMSRLGDYLKMKHEEGS